MLKLISVKPSDKKEKKLMATFSKDHKSIITHFGSSQHSDFTKHKDTKRRDLYDIRHKRRENWQDPVSAGTLSKYILWNKPTLSESIKDFKRRFNL